MSENAPRSTESGVDKSPQEAAKEALSELRTDRNNPESQLLLAEYVRKALSPDYGTSTDGSDASWNNPQEEAARRAAADAQELARVASELGSTPEELGAFIGDPAHRD